MLRRKIEQILLDWKNTSNHNDLLLKVVDNEEKHIQFVILQRKILCTVLSLMFLLNFMI